MTFLCICGLGSEQKQFKSTVVCASPVVKSLEFSPSPVPPEETAPSEKDVKKPEMEKQKEAALPAMQEVCTARKGVEKWNKERPHNEMYIVQIAGWYFLSV